MAGHADKPRVVSGDGRVQVAAANTGQTLLDARSTKPDASSIANLKRRAGAVYVELEKQGRAFDRELAKELNELSGGTAPASVQALRELAVSTLVLQRAAHFLAVGHLRKIAEADLDEDVQRHDEYFQKGARTAAGLGVCAKDHLVEARKMAKDAALTLPVTAANDNGSRDLLASLNIVPTVAEGEE
jgi:hypothetical protein